MSAVPAPTRAMVQPWQGRFPWRWAVAVASLLAAVGIWWMVGRPDALLVTSGESMLPVIHPGTLVILDPMGQVPLHVGQIVAVHIPATDQHRYHYPSVMLHRIIALRWRGKHWWFHTKGVHNAVPEPFWLPRRAAFGRPMVMIPKAGYAVEYLQSPWGWIGVGALAALYGGYRLTAPAWARTDLEAGPTEDAEPGGAELPSEMGPSLQRMAETLERVEADLAEIRALLAPRSADESPPTADGAQDSGQEAESRDPAPPTPGARGRPG